jgi:hypothetical protein
MAITITTSNGNAKIVNQNGLTTHIAVGLLLFDKGTNGVVEVANAAEDGVLLARGVITDFTIDGTGLTDENYDAVLTALKSSAVQVPVSISDPAKLETPATNSTGTWNWGQLLRGIFNKIRGSKGAVSTVFNGIQANATSPVIDCSGYNAVLVSVNFTDGAGTGVFSFALQGKFDTGGVMMDIYDNNGNPLTTGNITTNQVKLFAAVPDFIQIVATEITDGATITVRVQPINI